MYRSTVSRLQSGKEVHTMAINSYKEDENLKEVGKLKTLGRLFSYLLTHNLKSRINYTYVSRCLAQRVQ